MTTAAAVDPDDRFAALLACPGVVERGELADVAEAAGGLVPEALHP